MKQFIFFEKLGKSLDVFLKRRGRKKMNEDYKLGECTKILMDTLQEVFTDAINTMTNDIMQSKSVSLYEANLYAHRFLLMGIRPKSEEFYKEVDKIKTLW